MGIVFVSSIFSPSTFYKFMSFSYPHFVPHFLGPRMVDPGLDESCGFLAEHIELFDKI